MSLAQKIRKDKYKQRMKKENSGEKNTKDEKSTSNDEYMDKSLNMANMLWDDIKKRVKDDLKFVDMSDNDKIAVYQKTEFKDFYTQFPIVCRYMICMGQFSGKAFKRYLIKCKNAKPDNVKMREKNYSEDQWLMRQADYVRYLWESYQKQHFCQVESKNVWQHAYQTLKKEFEDFKNLHSEIENKLKNDEKNNKTELVKELLHRLATNEQSLNENASKDLLEKLKTQIYEQRKKTLINSIKNSIETIPPTRVSNGSRKELKPSKN